MSYIIQKQENVVIRFSEDENNIADKIQILIDLYKNKIQRVRKYYNYS